MGGGTRRGDRPGQRSRDRQDRADRPADRRELARLAGPARLGRPRRVPRRPGYATRVSRPHRHSRAFTTMQDAVVSAFTAAGAPPRMAWHSWYIFGTSLVTWLGAQEQRLMGDAPVRFDLFLDSLLRGLPAAEPPALGIRPPA
ncbi:hypothetical protein ACWV95_02140 [Streptomyces albus]